MQYSTSSLLRPRFHGAKGLALLGIALLSACSSDSKDDDNNQGGSGGAGGTATGESGNDSGGASGEQSIGGAGAGGSGETGGTGGDAEGGSDQGGAAGDSGATNEGGGGAGGSGGSLNGDADPTAGCGTPADQALETFVKYTIMVDSNQREFFVRLPVDYNPDRAYPTVIVGPGCDGTGDHAIPVQDASQGDAIVIGLNFSSAVTGRPCFMTESPTSPELPFFDAVLENIEAKYCIDKSRLFYGGFSSGSWLANLLGCARSDVLRGQGNAAGGPPPLPECRGPIAAIMAHDTGDGNNGIGGGRTARDRILAANGCVGTETTPWDAEFPDCKLYTGCPAEFPVVWCETSGKGHSDQIPLSTTGFWRFWSSLPKKPTFTPL